jgi:hypothetical protein
MDKAQELLNFFKVCLTSNGLGDKNGQIDVPQDIEMIRFINNELTVEFAPGKTWKVVIQEAELDTNHFEHK